MMQLLFIVGNMCAVLGGFFALFWVMTSSRFYWRKRRRGIRALVFLAVGIGLMAYADEGGAKMRQGEGKPSASVERVLPATDSGADLPLGTV